MKTSIVILAVVGMMPLLSAPTSGRAQGEIPVVSPPPALQNAVIIASAPVPAYSDQRLRSNVGTINAGASVRLLSAEGSTWYVEGLLSGKPQRFYVEASRLGPLPSRINEHIAKSNERDAEVKKLVRAEQVAVGMTAAEIAASVGKPDRIAEEATPDGSMLVWEYEERELFDVSLGVGVAWRGGRPGDPYHHHAPYRRPYAGVGVSIPGESKLMLRVTFEKDVAVKVEKFDE